MVSVRGCVAVVLNSSKRVTLGNDLNRGCTASLSGIALFEAVFHDLNKAIADANGACTRENGGVGCDCSEADTILCEAYTDTDSNIGLSV